MALTTTAEVMQLLRIRNADATVTAFYDTLRTKVEAAVIQYVKWPIELQSNVVDYYDGNGYRDLQLRAPWVASIGGVWIDFAGAYNQGVNSYPNNTQLTSGTDYALVMDGTVYAGSGPGTPVSKSGLLRRFLNSVFWFPSDLIWYRASGGLSYRSPPGWPAGYGNIKVLYTYGFATIPDDIKLAVATACGAIRNTVARGFPVGSESASDYSYSVAIARGAGPEFGTVRQLLSGYRTTSI